MLSRSRYALACAVLCMLASPVQAQWGIWAGDSLLAIGRLAAAESVYYAAARASPRDPVVRSALGKFLAARGAIRVGTVLLEEARLFGGDSIAIARALVPLYERLADFTAIDTLRPDVLTTPERRRAQWLRERAPAAMFRDSVVLIPYRPSADGDGVGTVTLRVGKVELPAVLDARISGLVLPRTFARDLRTFGAPGSTAVADVARIGGIVFTNVPATLEVADTAARIGFDVLAPYSPSFDPRRGVMTLRRIGRRSPRTVGARIPTLYDGTGVRMLVGERWQQMNAAMPAMLLATRTWMWDGRRGDIVLLGP